MPDPIRQLFDDLERDGKPSLAWVVEWSERAGGDDPVRAAWLASSDGHAIVSLALGKRVRRFSIKGGRALIAFEDGTTDDVTVAPGHDWEMTFTPAESADALRRAFPTPATLGELLSDRNERQIPAGG